MSLLQVVYRALNERGLVTKLLQQLPRLANLLILVSIAMLAILPFDGYYRNTYISENALMPAQAYSYFRETEWNILRGYRKQIETLEFKSVDERNSIMSEWLNEIGVKTAVYEDPEFGKTLYGVLHASRGDGTEAMVLATPWTNIDDQFNMGGTALGISLVRYFSRWPIWSKNIIIVFSENPRGALRSWVDAYHTSLDLTAGSLEAALVLDFPGNNDFFDYVEISYDGLNGELPNLDLLNVAVSITEHEHMRVSFHGIPVNEMYQGDYFSRLKIMFMGIKNWALAGVRKVHGNEAFSGWRVQSVTLKAHGGSGETDITCFGRIPEAVFRSVNNLLEKFHQSFFFYLLMAPRNFVSISSYLPSAVILSVSYAVAALHCVINNAYVGISFVSPYTLYSFVILSITILLSYVTSRALLLFPIGELLLYISVGIALLPLLFVKKRIGITKEVISLRLKAMGYLYYSLILTSLLMVNFALTFIIGLLAYPLVTLRVINTKMSSEELRKKSVRNTIILLITNPFISLWLFTSLFDDNLNNGFAYLYHQLLSGWTDLGCWTWFIICLGWLPLWLACVFSTIPTLAHPLTESSILDNKKDN
ncbi:GPI transamidase component GAA1 [Nakaseomyces bracarensis]|uniref:GPI transamidase component GAA1 n=1 Tax=Nakaseomyces bracarensis TaxID=273131 RepID=A0ABR4NXL9_9SACH